MSKYFISSHILLLIRANHPFWSQVFELVDGAWVLIYTFEPSLVTTSRSVARILWHPWNPYEMIIGLSDGTGIVASFEDQAGEVSWSFYFFGAAAFISNASSS